VREAASGRAGEPVRFGNRHVDRQTVLAETGSVSHGHAATVEAGGSGGAGPAGAPGVATHIAARGTESGQDDGGKGAVIAASASPFETNPGGGPVPPPITGKKTSQLSKAFPAQAPDGVPPETGSDAAGMPPARGEQQNTPGEAEGAVQFLPRQVRREAVSVERGAGPGGRAAVEKGGSDSVASLGIRGESSRPGGGEPRQDTGSKATASGTTPSPFRTGAVERIHQPLTGEKVASLPSSFAAAVGDTASIMPGVDSGEEVSSAGRQTVLLTQIIEAAQPLMQHGGGRVLISLNPPSLGALEIDVRVKNETVELFVIANNQDVQQTLCSHVEQLRKALIDQGLNMDRFQVVVGDRSGGQQGGGPRQEGMPGWQRESHNDRGGYRPEGDEETASDGMRKAVRTDVYPSVGGINVFI